MVAVNPPPNLRRPPNIGGDFDAYLRQMEWIIFQLWERTGGGDDVVTATANQQIDTDALFGLFSRLDDIEESVVNDEPVVLARLDEIEDALEVENVAGVVDLLQNVTSTAVDYTSVGDEIVICTGIVTVTLPFAPDDQQQVKVKRTNGQVTIDGNSKTIDGFSSVIINRQYTTLDMVYLVEQDAWFII